MINIKKGNTILTVSNYAYKEIFKSQGYVKVDETETNIKAENKKNTNVIQNKYDEDTDVVNSDKLTEKIDMGVNDNLFPSKEKKKSK